MKESLGTIPWIALNPFYVEDYGRLDWIMRRSSGDLARHRPAGQRAHRKWKRKRAAGRA